MDLALNSDLDVHLDGTNDLNTVEGQDELEQSIAITIYRTLNSGVGGLDKDDVRKRLERKAKRVGRENDFIDGAIDVNSHWHEDKPNTLVLRLIYASDELSELEFNV